MDYSMIFLRNNHQKIKLATGRDFPILAVLALLGRFFLRVTFSKKTKNRQEKLLVSQVNFLAVFFVRVLLF